MGKTGVGIRERMMEGSKGSEWEGGSKGGKKREGGSKEGEREGRVRLAGPRENR